MLLFFFFYFSSLFAKICTTIEVCRPRTSGSYHRYTTFIIVGYFADRSLSRRRDEEIHLALVSYAA